MKNSNFICIIFSIFFSYITIYANETNTNAIQPGKAKLSVKLGVVNRPGTLPNETLNVDSLLSLIDIYCANKSIFDVTDDETLTTLKRDRNIFYQEIPVECKEEIAGIRIYKNSKFQGGSLFMLKQDRINV